MPDVSRGSPSVDLHLVLAHDHHPEHWGPARQPLYFRIGHHPHTFDATRMRARLNGLDVNAYGLSRDGAHEAVWYVGQLLLAARMRRLVIRLLGHVAESHDSRGGQAASSVKAERHSGCRYDFNGT